MEIQHASASGRFKIKLKIEMESILVEIIMAERSIDHL